MPPYVRKLRFGGVGFIITPVGPPVKRTLGDGPVRSEERPVPESVLNHRRDSVSQGGANPIRRADRAFGASQGAGVMLSGGGIVPGPDVEHANASGVLPAAAKGGSAGKIGRFRAMAWRSMRWVRSLAFASR